MKVNERERNQYASSSQLTPMVLIKAIQQIFGIAVATTVATPESPTLLDLILSGMWMRL